MIKMSNAVGVRRTFAFPGRFATGGAIVALAMALASSGCASTTTDKAPSAAAKKPAAASAPKPKTAAVPRLLGMDRDDANAALRDAGLTIGAVTRQPSSEKAGSVLQQGTAPGSSLDPGSPVGLVLAAPLPHVPNVIGDAKASAVSQIKAAGFRVEVTTKRTTSGQDNVVLSQSPTGGTRVAPGEVVNLVVSDLHKPVTLSSAGNSNCTPGYTPCLPPASDYDCEGGSGDGPKYTGYVTVTGSDPYDLDNDGDGVACES